MKRYACMPQSEIREGLMSISAIQPEHIESIRIWRNEQMNVLRQSKLISPIEQIAYFDREIWPDMDSPQPRQILLSIFKHGKHVGYGGLVHLSWPDLRGEVSFLLNPEIVVDPAHYDRVFSAYLTMIKSLAFSDLGLNRIFTETFANRTAHITILERNGFIPEGRLKGHVRIDGQPVDSYFHGITNYD